MTVKLKKIPEFKNREEEANFWDTHDFTDYVDFSKKQDVKLIFELDKPKEESLVVRVQSSIKRALEKLAKSQGISPSTLVRMWMIEKLKKECYNS